MRRADFLLYAGIQFVVLTAIAMALYAGGTPYDPDAPGYAFFHNYLSDLGRTEALSGRGNLPASVVFGVALATVGVALIAFSSAWRVYGFARGRARAAGVASQVIGTASGACFVGIALTPWDLALTAHGWFVLAGFSLLLVYVGAMTILLVRNGADRLPIAANVVYIAALLGYLALILAGPHGDPEGHMWQVTGQKLTAYGSMIHLGVISMWCRQTSALKHRPASADSRRGSHAENPDGR